MEIFMHNITIVGTWPFPSDMLRYADAVPASTDDEKLVDLLSLPFCDEDNVDQVFNVQLRLSTVLNDTVVRRFESFGWRVSQGEGLSEIHAAAAERSRLSKLESHLAAVFGKLTSDEYDALQWYAGGRLPRNISATFR
jgi:hypothetical protein